MKARCYEATRFFMSLYPLFLPYVTKVLLFATYIIVYVRK
jgi:hypothetical protein